MRPRFRIALVFLRRSQNDECESPVGSTAGLGNESIITLSLCIFCFCHVSGISRPEYAPPRSQPLCKIACGVVNFASSSTEQILTLLKDSNLKFKSDFILCWFHRICQRALKRFALVKKCSRDERYFSGWKNRIARWRSTREGSSTSMNAFIEHV